MVGWLESLGRQEESRWTKFSLKCGFTPFFLGPLSVLVFPASAPLRTGPALSSFLSLPVSCLSEHQGLRKLRTRKQFLAFQGEFSCSKLHVFLNLFSKWHHNYAGLSYNATHRNDFCIDQYILWHPKRTLSFSDLHQRILTKGLAFS